MPSPKHVFIAYADTYIGGQVLKQFEDKPTLFTVHGCTWEKDAAQSLQEQSAAAAAADAPRATAPDTGSPLGGDAEETRSAGSAASPSVPPRRSATPTPPPLSESAATSATASPGAVPSTSPAARFFWRSDHTAVNAALRQADWIILELRQSQVVFDVLRVVQSAATNKPRRLVLLSSFMTWYATPPLTAPETAGEGYEGGEKGGGDRGGEDDNDNDEDAAPEEEEQEEEELTAPYPPPPEDPESDTEGARAAAREEAAIAGQEEENNDDEDDDGADGLNAEGEGSAGEIFTEDQYNRRIPHVKYFNWRDAEKAVAAAHHADGSALETFVVFCGLPYGEGEGPLQPIFRQAWSGLTSAAAAASSAVSAAGHALDTLPIYGDGKQRVPMVHVRDLATFTRKLLRCPTAELPNPNARYLFATDGAQLTWKKVVEGINAMFGRTKRLVHVPPDEFPLHPNVELFTVNLRVDNESMRAIMDREESGEKPEERLTLRGLRLHVDSSGYGATWLAQGGIRRNREKVSLEFRALRQVTPLRVVLLGPPLVGKTFIAQHLAAHYELPHFTIEDVVAEYMADVQRRKKQLEDFHAELLHTEKERRRAIKRRRALYQQRRGAPQKTEEEEGEDDNENENAESAAGDRAHREGVASGRPPRATAVPSAAERPSLVQRSASKAASGISASSAMSVSAAPLPDSDADGEDVEEREEVELDLTPEEEQEAEELMAERFATSARATRWRAELARMERILLLRIRPAPPTPNTNPKKRAPATKKKLTKEQQRKKEEEELQLAKEALKDAPFQDRALAIMLRWRLARADCRNQGYILDGFPTTVDQARLCFGVEPIEEPQTEEEAVQQPPPPPGGARAGAADNGADDDDGSGGNAEDRVEGGAPHDRATEPSEEHRLPDYVVLLTAPQNYLLDRLTALGETEQPAGASVSSISEPPMPSAAGPTASTVSGTTPTAVAGQGADPTDTKAATALEKFYTQWTVYQTQCLDHRYTLMNYFDSAVTVPAGVRLGGRRVWCHVVDTQCEPLVPPPPPASAYAAVAPCVTEAALRERIGDPHYFGLTPQQRHEEEVRKRHLAQEARDAADVAQRAQQEKEAAAYDTEAAARAEDDAQLMEMKRQDLAALEARKAPLRAYLMQSVLPLLSKGLVEVCARRPEDPVDFLAEWLIKHNPHDDVFCDL